MNWLTKLVLTAILYLESTHAHPSLKQEDVLASPQDSPYIWGIESLAAKEWCSIESGLGCFHKNDFNGKLKLPWSVDDVGTTMRYYGWNTGSKYEIIDWDSRKKNIPRGLNSNKKLIVLIHGLCMSGNHQNILFLKDEIYKNLKNSVNVIVVDWGKGAVGTKSEVANTIDAAFYYNNSAANTRVVGRQINLVLQKLINKTNLDPKNIHLIGFSLGAHTAGFAGKDFYKATKKRVGRISALDPANKAFQVYEKYPPDTEPIYVNSNDAEYVDVIHTSASIPNIVNLSFQKFGMTIPIGHVDYYPNGGTDQPYLSDCETKSDVQTGCDHWTAIFYYAASLSSTNKFKSIGCDNYIKFSSNKCDQRNLGQMGYYSPQSSGKGKQYLKTLAKYPYVI